MKDEGVFKWIITRKYFWITWVILFFLGFATRSFHFRNIEDFLIVFLGSLCVSLIVPAISYYWAIEKKFS